MLSLINKVIATLFLESKIVKNCHLKLKLQRLGKKQFKSGNRLKKISLRINCNFWNKPGNRLNFSQLYL